ncbi:acyltransferase family protein [Micromonospora sp. NPDC003197]
MAVTDTTTTVGTRSAGIDLLRVGGIAAVVVGHVWINDITRAAIYTWHVPLFFVLTGYFWTPGRTVRTEVRRRWRTLGVPYLLWFLLLFLMLVAADMFMRDLAPTTFQDAVYGGSAAVRPFSAFWFVSVLFLLAIAHRWLERFGAAATWAVGLVGLAAAYLAPEAVTAGPLGLFLVPACLTFVAAGRLLRQLRARISVVTAALMVVLGAVLAAVGLGTPLDLKAGNFGFPGVGVLTAILISSGLVVLAEQLDPYLDGRPADMIGRLSACGIAVVLSHAAVLWVLGTQPNGGWLDLLAALLLPWGFALVMLGTRLGPYVTGTRAGQG